MNRKIKWGVIGSGGIARRRTIPEGFVPARNAELVAVYGTNQATNSEVAKEFGARAVASVDELLNDGVDAVYVASPVDAHLEQVRACARAGKHVLCEKPLGRTVAEAEKMAASCKTAGVELGTAFMMRFHTQHQAAAALIQAGQLGKPTFARAQLSCWYPPSPGAWRQNPDRAGGGALMDLASHCLDLLELFFGSIDEVACFMNRTIHDYRSEDSAAVLLRFANGALGTVDTLFCIRDESSRNALELYGSRGGIIARDTIGQGSAGEMTAWIEPAHETYDAHQARDPIAGRKIEPAPRNTYRAEIEAFSDALLEDKANPLSADLGVRSQKLLAACYESAGLGRMVSV